MLGVENNHHVAGKDMCVGVFFVVAVWGNYYYYIL